MSKLGVRDPILNPSLSSMHIKSDSLIRSSRDIALPINSVPSKEGLKYSCRSRPAEAPTSGNEGFDVPAVSGLLPQRYLLSPAPKSPLAR